MIRFADEEMVKMYSRSKINRGFRRAAIRIWREGGKDSAGAATGF